MGLKDLENLLCNIRYTVDSIINVFLLEGKAYLFENFLVQGVPVVSLLGH